MPRLEITQTATSDVLPVLRAFIENACEQTGVTDRARVAIELSMDEACVNVVEHGYENLEPGPITIIFDHDGTKVTITILDNGQPFDPAAVPPPDLESEWQERRIGGLGWYFIQQLMDAVNHDYHPEHGNRLTLVKELSTTPAMLNLPDFVLKRIHDMELKAEPKDGVTVISINGYIDVVTVTEVSDFLTAQLKGGAKQFVADLSQVGYISSAGLRTLLAALKESRNQGGDFRLATLQKNVRDVLDLAGFLGIFKTFATVDEAVQSFKG